MDNIKKKVFPTYDARLNSAEFMAELQKVVEEKTFPPSDLQIGAYGISSLVTITKTTNSTAPADSFKLNTDEIRQIMRDQPIFGEGIAEKIGSDAQKRVKEKKEQRKLELEDKPTRVPIKPLFFCRAPNKTCKRDFKCKSVGETPDGNFFLCPYLEITMGAVRGKQIRSGWKGRGEYIELD